MVKLSEINIYPIKSIAGNKFSEATVGVKGLQNDRMRAVSSGGKILTGREYPKLLGISSRVEGEKLILSEPTLGTCLIDLSIETSTREVGLFSLTISGDSFGNHGAEWFSELLGVPCTLIAMNQNQRPILERHNGKAGDTVSFADASPILLLSEASLEDLNSRLAEPVTMEHFRPNLVVSGTLPYEEDNWKTITINDTLFEVHMKCPRCIFTTIHPETQDRHPKGEPLKTLAEYRKTDQKVEFGIYLIPRKTGVIQVGNEVEVE